MIPLLPRAGARVLFALFALSGFTGLVYESVWSHYLKLFLGAAAPAQSFVLAAFMGGMALGAWLASRWSARGANLLAAYGWIEGLIGIAALVFHEVFVALTEASLTHVIPVLGSPGLVDAWKYAVCALLVVPQAVLLGMTFPLMSGAVLRRFPLDATGAPASGHHLASLYFTNSIGAAAGALAGAFWLLGAFGMPGTLRVAGALNLALAAAVLALARSAEPRPPRPTPAQGARPVSAPIVRLFLAAAFVTGAASFIYEIAWIRMLSLVLGSSFQAFELMLSAFITGLALGGLWIRRRIDRIANPVRFAGFVQLAMALAALATVPVYHASFGWMEWALHAVQRSEAGYPLFNLISHGLAFAVMLPATFFAGMTLPLFTHVLLRGGYGERAIGQVYASNTLGAIVGVLLAVHLLVPEAGFKLALVVGAAADALLGGYLLRWSGAARQRFEAFAAVIGGLVAATLVARLAVLEPELLASGVFRYGSAEPKNNRILYYRDGKTATVAITATPSGARIVSTNGKPDAAIQMDPSQPRMEDEYTMTLLGALPLLAKPEARTFANIGLGSGLTAETILSHSGPVRVDTIEIEPAMGVAALAFSPRVDRLFRDKRARMHFEDAKSFFARHGERYDVIVSEPSNPWVNGVASLFTTEFYREALRALAPDGLFVQWLHFYELDDRLLGSMFAALDANFGDYEVYQSSAGDLVVLAVREGRVPVPRALPAGEAGFLETLRLIGVERIEQVLARRIGSKRQLAPLYALYRPPLNSDYEPVLQLEATRARFVRKSALAIIELANAPVPVNEMLGGLDVAYLTRPVAGGNAARLVQMNGALELHAVLARGRMPADRSPPPQAVALRQPGVLCVRQPARYTLDQLHAAAFYTLAHLGPAERRELWVEPRWIGCPLERTAPEVRERFAVYRAVAQRDARAMLERSRALLEGPSVHGLDWARFLLVSAMLGAQASGQGEEARRLWQQHAPALIGANTSPFELYLATWR